MKNAFKIQVLKKNTSTSFFNMFKYTYIGTYICACLCMYIHMYAYICMYTHTGCNFIELALSVEATTREKKNSL